MHLLLPLLRFLSSHLESSLLTRPSPWKAVSHTVSPRGRLALKLCLGQAPNLHRSQPAVPVPVLVPLAAPGHSACCRAAAGAFIRSQQQLWSHVRDSAQSHRAALKQKSGPRHVNEMGTNPGRAMPVRWRSAECSAAGPKKCCQGCCAREKKISEVLEAFTPLNLVSQAGNPCISLLVGPPARSVPAIGHRGGKERKENETSF